MILVLGAGDIKECANALAEMMAGQSVPANGYSADRALVDELKRSLKGAVKLREELSKRTSLKIGGWAQVWVEPADAQDLKKALAIVKKSKVPMFIMGNGSNVLASDSGFNGIVIHLGAASFKKVAIHGGCVQAGAGYSLPKLVRTACDKGLAGLESLVGIPGTVGGAVYMNAGGYNNPMYRNIGEVLTAVKVMDYNGAVKTIKKDDLKLGYRSSNLDKYIILEAEFKLEKGDRASLMASCGKFMRIKKEKQVLDKPNAGCFFKNPDNFQFTCGQLIDMLKLKGKTIGGAQISEKHANFIINKGNATCGDVLELVAFIKDSVKKNYGIDLELEVKVI
jgi:UDP-N-acetylmuramate dehydrogenase